MNTNDDISKTPTKKRIVVVGTELDALRLAAMKLGIGAAIASASVDDLAKAKANARELLQAELDEAIHDQYRGIIAELMPEDVRAVIQNRPIPKRTVDFRKAPASVSIVAPTFHASPSVGRRPREPYYMSKGHIKMLDVLARQREERAYRLRSGSSGIKRETKYANRRKKAEQRFKNLAIRAEKNRGRALYTPKKKKDAA